jgi:hypothetical protein
MINPSARSDMRMRNASTLPLKLQQGSFRARGTAITSILVMHSCFEHYSSFLCIGEKNIQVFSDSQVWKICEKKKFSPECRFPLRHDEQWKRDRPLLRDHFCNHISTSFKLFSPPWQDNQTYFLRKRATNCDFTTQKYVKYETSPY